VLDKVISTPKLSNGNIYNNSYVYKYYAGYSDSFVVSQLEKLTDITEDSIILDPWNGSGTTTLVASILGYKNYGFDLNPVMILVAKAKLYYPSQKDIEEISNLIKLSRKIRKPVLEKDPLGYWFDIDTVLSIRKLELCIRRSCGDKNTALMKLFMNIDNVTPRLAFYYVVLFELLRQYTDVFVGSNPTWVKSVIHENEKLNKKFNHICCDYLSQLNKIVPLLDRDIDFNKSIIQTGDSRKIHLADNSVNCIITSPPYCTRIDYAVYTRVELALIGYSEDEFSSIRRGMIGTPTIKREIDSKLKKFHIWNEVLQKIRTHNSKAAESYYYKTYCQYFTDMEQSISEMSRVLKYGAIVSLVLQDSWFKDVHIDLPDIIYRLLEVYNFELLSLQREKVVNNMKYINTRSKAYGDNNNHEAVLTMRKKGN
jgi:DNA modification methylase